MLRCGRIDDIGQYAGNFDSATAEADYGIWLASNSINSTVSSNTDLDIGLCGGWVSPNRYHPYVIPTDS